MPPARQDWAKVEWEFLRFDPRYDKLPCDAERMAYLHLWVACVHIRRDTYERTEITCPLLADICGVAPSLLASMVASSLAHGLLVRGPRGSVTVEGVKRRHPALRGWNESKTRLDCGPIDALRERERVRVRGDSEDGVCSEASGDASEPPPSPAAYVFDAELMRGTHDGPWMLTEDLHATLHTAYPEMNLLGEYARMAAWLKANPGRRKTHRGMAKFVRNWVERAQNQGDAPHGYPARGASGHPSPRHFEGAADDQDAYRALDHEARERAGADRTAEGEGPA